MNDTLAQLADTPRRLRELASQFDESRIRTRAADGTFSVLEHACHLRDIEELAFAVRIRRIEAEERPELADVDGDKLAEEGDYHGTQQLGPALDRFAELRAANVAQLEAADLTREGILEGAGLITLAELARRMHGHDRGHLDELEKLRAELE